MRTDLTLCYFLVVSRVLPICFAETQSGYPLIHETYYMGSLEACKAFLLNKKVLKQKDSRGMSPLRTSTWKNLYDLFRLPIESDANSPFNLLIYKNTYLDVQDEDALTPLHCAVKIGNSKICRHLIESEADLSLEDERKRTLGHFARVECKPDIVKILVEKEPLVND